ncbi:methyltransferase family protein [Aequorivita sublithincola DSM 14238]|uniref:Methyltransferase family protein n=1 Tax=Aequorivita sublithincola (strain DSM 14238 / LMG 21431 / ACAM 643 / 9-3) TaxID=746697 RepID=I3YYU6_AEQSU|nr:methyltransferase domain-containing protein [Aequorivita sublithincola]AFL82164.1 methyltransferase family protein [Aequorivita sublithincola DSM 14238]
MIAFSNKHRSIQAEIMDDLDFQGEEMKHLLDDLKNVNKWLGGNSITIDGLKELLKNHPNDKILTILDIGCGDGELLRKCTDFGKKNNFNFKCIGIDFNQNILEIAENRSSNYPNLTFKKVDVFLEEELIPNCDIALCTLFLHHFSNEQIENLLKTILKKTEIGLIVNDLQRSKQAFFLFKIVSKLFLKTKTARHDGLVSIARGFKKNELEAISTTISNQKSTIHWRWAYRYQWISKNTN